MWAPHWPYECALLGSRPKRNLHFLNPSGRAWIGLFSPVTSIFILPVLILRSFSACGLMRCFWLAAGAPLNWMRWGGDPVSWTAVSKECLKTEELNIEEGGGPVIWKAMSTKCLKREELNTEEEVQWIEQLYQGNAWKQKSNWPLADKSPGTYRSILGLTMKVF